MAEIVVLYPPKFHVTSECNKVKIVNQPAQDCIINLSQLEYMCAHVSIARKMI